MKDNSMQLHRTDVSQDAFTKEMKVRAQRELHQAVGVMNVDGDIMIKEEQGPDKKKQARHSRKKERVKTKTMTGEAQDDEGNTSTIDIRI
jgi:hypothetical protein